MNKQYQQKNESGLVAIIVASIIMVILSLVTLGFARIMQREQRQALDRTLSTQAFYAAESAINEVESSIKAGTLTADKTTCAAGTTPYTGNVDAARNVSYSCLLIDQSPQSLEYSQLSTTDFKTIPIKSESGAQISIITLAWDDPTLPDSDAVGKPATTPVFNDCTAADPTLPVSWPTTPKSPGMVQVDLIPVGATLSRAGLINDTIHLYLYPCKTASGVSAINWTDHSAATSKGKIVPVACSAIPAAGSSRDCSLSINLTSIPTAAYYMRVRSIYKTSGLTIRAFDSTLNQLPLVGAQVLVDSTGKVADVLRRVQVRLPSYLSYAVPDYVIHTTDSICKQISVTPTSATNSCGL
ncbi:MAG: hypothetical protein WCJ60_04220 [bacterium]